MEPNASIVVLSIFPCQKLSFCHHFTIILHIHLFDLNLQISTRTHLRRLGFHKGLANLQTTSLRSRKGVLHTDTYSILRTCRTRKASGINIEAGTHQSNVSNCTAHPTRWVANAHRRLLTNTMVTTAKVHANSLLPTTNCHPFKGHANHAWHPGWKLPHDHVGIFLVVTRWSKKSALSKRSTSTTIYVSHQMI